MSTQNRKEARNRRRRIIVNNDGNDCVHLPREGGISAARFIESRTSPLVGSQVDAIFYCTGVFNFSGESQVIYFEKGLSS